MEDQPVIPGPKSQELWRTREDAIPRGISNGTPIVADRARGAEVWDIDGNRLIDFTGGIGVHNSGHLEPSVLRAARTQLEKLTHTSFQVLMYESYIQLAVRLGRLVPVDGPVKTMLVSTGAEAVENAIKIARHATGRRGIVAFEGGFHGRTLLSMSLTGKTSYRSGFGPLATDIYHLPYPSQAGSLRPGVRTQDVLDAFQELFLYTVPANEVAAVIVEPVQGEGGFQCPDADFFPALRELTQKHGILLIDDEIQAGMGRTGTLYALEHWDVKADMVLSAKSLAAGFPLAAVSGRAEIMDAPPPGTLGGTYAGNPVACAAALAVLDLFEHGDLLERSHVLGQRLGEQFAAWQTEFPQVGEIRGLGAMRAFDLVEDGHPATALAARVAEEAYHRGLILIRAGIHSNVIRVLVPLNVTSAVLEEGLSLLHAALHAALRSPVTV